MAVLHTVPAGDPAGKVGIFFDAPGIRDATAAFCRKLAGDGYEVIVPDLYHRDIRLFSATPEKRAADPGVVDQMRGLMANLTDANIQQDMDDAAQAVGWEGPMGCIGFCLGARAVHRAMTRAPKRFVVGSMFHPSFLVYDSIPDSPHASVSQLRGGLHIGIGTADQVQSIEMHQQYFDAIAGMDNVELSIFDGADHGFTWPEYDATYHHEASTTCYGKTLALLGTLAG